MDVREHDETIERLTNLGHLSSGVGHHVINAFAAIVSNAELLRLKAPPTGIADPHALAETIIQAAVQASTVARRLIDYTRPVTSIDPDRAAFEPQRVELPLLLDEFIELERPNRPGIEWTFQRAEVPPIQGHSDQLRSMFRHFLANACEAMPGETGTIQFSTAQDTRGWIVVEVRDSGQGMDPSTLERAVEPFFSTRPGHLGVGLSIANGIWRRHRGTLSIRSQPGEGTTIRLCVEPLKS